MEGWGDGGMGGGLVEVHLVAAGMAREWYTWRYIRLKKTATACH